MGNVVVIDAVIVVVVAVALGGDDVLVDSEAVIE